MAFLFEQFFATGARGEGELSLFNGRYQLQVAGSYRGQWDELKKRLILEEHLEFSNDHNQQRVWRFTKNGLYNWQGVCPGEIEGEVKGQMEGKELVLRYQFLFPVWGPARLPLDCVSCLTPAADGRLGFVTSMKLFGVIPFGLMDMRLTPVG